MFRNIWVKWKQLAKIIGEFEAKVIFTVFYFGILWIAGIGTRLWGDPLHTKKTAKNTNWETWDHPNTTLSQAEKQS